MEAVVGFATNVSKGTKMPVVAWSDFASYQMALPPQKTREAFGNTIGPLFEGITVNIKQSQTLTKLRETLLPKLISGELRIPEAEQLTEEALA